MNVKKPFQQGTLIVMLLALILYLPAEVFPGTTGKIAGRLLDAQTGDPLPGANVVVQGTTLGAATDIEGYYTILRMPPGTYILEITMIGYKKIIHTNVIVNVDLTSTQNFGLEATVIEGAEITTTARRPLVIRDLTSSSTRVSAAEIEDIPNVNSVTDAIVLMPGVIGEGEEIHVRGGRSGEVVYLIDGIAVNDPLFNDEVIDVNKYAIDEVELLTGGYNAEYGNVQSGVVNIVPRTGGSKLSGRFAYFTDDFGSGKFPGDILNDARSSSDPLALFLVDAQKTFKPEGTGLRSNSFNTDRWEFNLGGPVPMFGDKLSFFVSATAEMSDGFLPNEDQSATLLSFPELFDTSELVKEPGEADAVTFDLSNPSKVDHPFKSSFLGLFDFGGRFNNNVNYTGVLNFRPAADYKASLTFVGSQFWQDDYRHLYKFQSDLTNQVEGTNSNTVFTWTHTVSPSTFYEAKFAYTRNNRLQYPGIRNGVRLTPFFQNSRITGLGEIDDDLLGQGDGGDQPFNTSFIDSYIASNPDLFSTDADSIAFVNAVSGFQRFGLDGAGTWSKHLSQVYTAKVDFVSQVTRNHQLKGGFEWRFNDLEQQRIDDGTNKVPSRRIAPPDDGPFITSGSLRDFYDRQPNRGSLYIQDKIEFESLIVNLGLRFDHFDPGAEVFEINEAFQTDETEEEVINDKNYLSPRIGISHPITDRSTLYFFYGRFVQIPELSELYRRQNFFRIFQNQLNTFGNPDLQAEETISYEVGFDHQLTDNLKIGVTGFFKDKRNQINLETFGPDAAPFQKLVNRDFGSDRGFEVEFIKRYSNHIAANINYTLMWATTRSSTFGRGIGAQGAQSFPNLKEVPADWDQRHTINGNISLEFPAGQGFKFLGATIDRLGLNTFIRYGSGLPFTIDEDAPGGGQALENSARLPYFLTVDLRLRKDFKIHRDLLATFYIDVNNLFNRRNLDFLVNDELHRCVECEVPIRDAAGNVIGSEIKTFKNGNPKGDGGESDLNPEQFGAPRQILLGLSLRF